MGSSALIVGALVAYLGSPSRKFVAVVMALGTGVLIGSVSFELIDDAVENASVLLVGVGTLVGAGVFTLGNWWLVTKGAGNRKHAGGAQAEGSPMAIVLGSVLDGIPESFILGLTVLQGALSVPLLAGILLSNFPEGMSSSSGLRLSGWPLRRLLRMWMLVLAASAISSAAGFVVLDTARGETIAVIEAFAGGALLAMLADTLLPESFEVEGVFTGSWVAAGFALSLMLASL